MDLIIATRNPDKAREVKSILLEFGIQARSLEDVDPEGRIPRIRETGSTLRENALIKARTVHAATGKPVIADDTGLEVDALNGAPGVHSARYAGEGSTYDDNINKLLDALKNVPSEKRTARFRTVACFVDGAPKPSGETELWAEGVVEGVIRTGREGIGGFGYDPVFMIPGTGKTYAQLSDRGKNRLSHRGQALRKLVAIISRDSIPTDPSSTQSIRRSG
ncbi:MAG: RdgB/HAM1 family non-canonical purine NTP pyrophosphatase [Fidelibacterota bacterium]